MKYLIVYAINEKGDIREIVADLSVTPRPVMTMTPSELLSHFQSSSHN